MVCQFVRVTITGNNLEEIATFLNTIIDKKDLHGDIETILNENTLKITIYNKNKAKNYAQNLKTYLQNNKDSLTSVNVIKYDICTHDEDNPQPCQPIEVFSWP